MTKKRTLIFAIVLIVLAGVIGLTVQYKKQMDTYTIGICQFAQHESLNAASTGFKDALTDILGDRVSFYEQNANGDYTVNTTIINDFISKEVDLILANSTLSLQASAAATEDIPVLGTSVTDYGAALQLDDFNGVVGGNVSGTSDFVSPDEQAAMIQELFPDAAKVGILYCSSESNSEYQAEALQDCLTAMGYACESYLFVSSNDISTSLETAVSECDVLYIPTDNTIAASAGLISNTCMPEKVPVITGDESTCQVCGAATLSVDYYSLGYATGEMAAQVLAEGRDISTIPVQYASSFSKKYNEEICRELGITVPEDYVPLETE